VPLKTSRWKVAFHSHAVGIYGLAYRFMEAAIPLGAFITFAIFPLLVRDEPDHER